MSSDERSNLIDRFRLEGRVAVVTGSGLGIGRGIALGLADAGADMVLNARRAETVAATATLVRDRGRRAAECIGDVRELGAEELARTAIAELGRLDIWVNNVGGSDDKTTRTLTDTTDDTFRSQIELNLTTAFQGAKAAAEHMVAGSAIVNIASGAGMRGSPFTGPYAAAKAAMLNLTETLALELVPRGIRVNAVSPGPVATEAYDEVLGMADRLAEVAASIPLGRMGTPDDIAAAVLYLASDAAGWVTGQNILVAGGRTHRSVHYEPTEEKPEQKAKVRT